MSAFKKLRAQDSYSTSYRAHKSYTLPAKYLRYNPVDGMDISGSLEVSDTRLSSSHSPFSPYTFTFMDTTGSLPNTDIWVPNVGSITVNTNGSEEVIYSAGSFVSSQNLQANINFDYVFSVKDNVPSDISNVNIELFLRTNGVNSPTPIYSNNIPTPPAIGNAFTPIDSASISLFETLQTGDQIQIQGIVTYDDPINIPAVSGSNSGSANVSLDARAYFEAPATQSGETTRSINRSPNQKYPEAMPLNNNFVSDIDGDWSWDSSNYSFLPQLSDVGGINGGSIPVSSNLIFDYDGNKPSASNETVNIEFDYVLRGQHAPNNITSVDSLKFYLVDKSNHTNKFEIAEITTAFGSLTTSETSLRSGTINSSLNVADFASFTNANGGIPSNVVLDFELDYTRTIGTQNSSGTIQESGTFSAITQLPYNLNSQDVLEPSDPFASQEFVSGSSGNIFNVTAIDNLFSTLSLPSLGVSYSIPNKRIDFNNNLDSFTITFPQNSFEARYIAQGLQSPFNALGQLRYSLVRVENNTTRTTIFTELVANSVSSTTQTRNINDVSSIVDNITNITAGDFIHYEWEYEASAAATGGGFELPQGIVNFTVNATTISYEGEDTQNITVEVEPEEEFTLTIEDLTYSGSYDYEISPATSSVQNFLVNVDNFTIDYSRSVQSQPQLPTYPQGSCPIYPAEVYSNNTNSVFLDSVKQLYFSNFQESSEIQSGSFYNFIESSIGLDRQLTTPMLVLSIPQNFFGEGVKPGTFMLSSGSYDITDDGEGNLINNGQNVGNIIYSHGMVLLPSGMNSNYLPISAILNSEEKDFQVSFKNTHTVITNEYRCTVAGYEMNYTQNPTSKTSSGLVWNLVDQEWQLVESTWNAGDDVEQIMPDLVPYVTTVGLYNESNQLIAVGKLNVPIRRTEFIDQTFVVRYDN